MKHHLMPHEIAEHFAVPPAASAHPIRHDGDSSPCQPYGPILRLGHGRGCRHLGPCRDRSNSRTAPHPHTDWMDGRIREAQRSRTTGWCAWRYSHQHHHKEDHRGDDPHHDERGPSTSHRRVVTIQMTSTTRITMTKIRSRDIGGSFHGWGVDTDTIISQRYSACSRLVASSDSNQAAMTASLWASGWM